MLNGETAKGGTESIESITIVELSRDASTWSPLRGFKGVETGRNDGGPVTPDAGQRADVNSCFVPFVFLTRVSVRCQETSMCILVAASLARGDPVLEVTRDGGGRGLRCAPIVCFLVSRTTNQHPNALSPSRNNSREQVPVT